MPSDARSNILLITADDLNADAVGAFGCPMPGTTPQVDRLAAQGRCFDRAHITIAVCQPSRGTWMTGRYPHRNGMEGFHPSPYRELPQAPGLLRQAGYRIGCLGKVTHTLPTVSTIWDHAIDMGQLVNGRSPERYRQEVSAFIAAARVAGQPWFLVANSHDPHRPFHDSEQERQLWGADFQRRRPRPSRVYTPDEVVVPAFLPDLPEVRLELAEYYSSVRRFDDSVGAILEALDASGAAADTLVMLTTDHGMPLPFAKTNCFLHSTRTPLIARFPGVTTPGTRDTAHFVGGIDFMPTFLEAAGVSLPADLDGRSILPLLRGESQAGRDRCFTQFHETAARGRYPMRAIHDPRYLYIFNPWSDGERSFNNESQSGRTWAAMCAAAAAGDAAIAARVRSFAYREMEELYDTAADPDCLQNLIADPAHAAAAASLRGELRAWMEQTGDVALGAFDGRHDPAILATFMAQQDAWGPRLRAAGHGLAPDPR